MISQIRGGRLVLAYFNSGWAFLLPYVAVYFVYAWFKWPVNPGNESWIPPLLHVYWFTHGAHLILGVFALYHWVRQRSLADLWPLVPWLLLGLIFWTPGTYLEFPADPWEHYARMNRWKGINEFGEGLGWYYKQTYYFFAYSLLGQFSVGRQLLWLDIYQAALSLLISFQYYRLARACRLGIGSSMILILLQPLLFGNDLWGFYRYYILASSGFSLLAAVVVTRLAVQLSDHFKSSPCGPPPSPLEFPPPSLLVMAILAAGLSALNHIQGLAICGLGVFGVVMWHAVKLHRLVVISLVGLLLLACGGALLWWTKHPVLDEVYRSTGWLNFWYGFDVFSPASNATNRMILIMGLAGLFNLAAGIFLIRRNHIAGWLTLAPILALQLTFISIPLANAFAKSSPAGIVAFHRLFFAIPAGLALAALGQQMFARVDRGETAQALASASLLIRHVPFGLILLAFGYFTLAPPSYPFCNRLWSNYAVLPADLEMRDVLMSFYQLETRPPTLVIASAAVSNALHSYEPIESLFSSQERLMHLMEPRTPAADLMRIRRFVESDVTNPAAVYLPPQPYLAFTTRSDTAFMTRHWNPVELSLAHTR